MSADTFAVRSVPLRLMLCACLAAAALTVMAQQAAPTTGLADASAPALRDPGDLEIEQFYTRYLSGGRGEVQIHLSRAGDSPRAQTHARGDGTFVCLVSGLRAAGAGGNAPGRRALRAGSLIHETTHCHVSPYAMDLIRDDGPDEAGNALVRLTLESVSDARAVIELARRDGLVTARHFVTVMLRQRILMADVSHSTFMALKEAFDLVRDQASSVKTDEQAFAAAVRIGRRTAQSTLRRLMPAEGQRDPLGTAAFADTSAALDAAMHSAVRAFEAGRFENRVVTLCGAGTTEFTACPHELDVHTSLPPGHSSFTP